MDMLIKFVLMCFVKLFWNFECLKDGKVAISTEQEKSPASMIWCTSFPRA